MDKLYDLITAVAKPRYEEDFVDRLNYRVSGIILLTAAFTLSAESYIGEPLQCWVPKQFKDGWEQYVEDYCFVENTYWVPFNDSIPRNHMERGRRELSYYQWVPFILALQALMINIPHIIWRMLNRLSGIEVRAIITMTTERERYKEDDKEKEEDKKLNKVEKVKKHFWGIITMAANHLNAGLLLNRRDYSISKRSFNPLMRFTGAYITIVYLSVKVLFIVGCILQFVIFNAFLGVPNNIWGITMFSDLMANRNWNSTGHFPRVTMCDFEVRELGNTHRHTVQCVLMINMFNEKVFIFLWWWFAVVIIVTILNFLYWLVTSVVSVFRDQFLMRMLNAQGILIRSTEDQRKFNHFSNSLVRSDGMVVLRLLTSNAGEFVGSAVVARMWQLLDDDGGW